MDIFKELNKSKFMINNSKHRSIEDIKKFIRDYLKELNGGIDLLPNNKDNTEIVISSSEENYKEELSSESSSDEFDEFEK
jgi:hypothetical protein